MAASWCAMEASGRQPWIWRLLRPAVIATGPLKVLRRMGADGYLDERIPQVVERWGAERVLKRLCVNENAIDMADAAWERLADLATSGKRLSLPTREAANRVALDLLDACAELPEEEEEEEEDIPGATLAGSVVEVIGTNVARMEFDSGAPGSGQVMEAWRVQKKIFVTGDTGAVAIYDNLTDVLAWWISDWHYADIECSGLKVSSIEALGLVPSDDSQADRSMRINGRWWKRRDAMPGT
jgi:hypothetical protein